MTRMIRHLLGGTLAVGLACAGSALAADDVAPAAPNVAIAPPGVLSLAGFDPQTPTLPPDDVDAFETVVLIEGREHEVALRRHSVRSPHFQVRVANSDGMLEEVVPPPVRTYVGEVRGVPGSVVAASLIDGQFSAIATMPDGGGWAIEPAADLIPGAPAMLHLGFNFEEVLPGEGTCGAGGLAFVRPDAGESDADDGPPDPEPAEGSEWVADIAFDSDVEFFQFVGGTEEQVVYVIERIVNGLNTIYRRDVGISHAIRSIFVRPNESDPYSSSDSDVLLCQFRNHWNEEWTGLPRDTAHLMTGREIDGDRIGLAWTGVMCNSVGVPTDTCPTEGNLAYGLSQSTQKVFAERVALTAHELGHNWNANHCNGDGDCAIMCDNLGGCTGLIDRFGSRARTSIVSHRNHTNCLFTCDSFVNVPAESTTIDYATIRACWDGVIAIQAGSYSELPRFHERVEIRAVGGLVIIGQ